MSHRTHILETASNLVTGDREEDYGSPQVNFGHIALRWSQHVGVPLEGYQVALMMADLKIARMVSSGPHEDSFVDICGYAALAAELSEDE
tara:strand:+ start:251 stop:520 length:270 start_codon:yes stop_codon:yes gene_type:complete